MCGEVSDTFCLADNKLFFTSTDGVTTVIEPTRTYRQLGRNELFGQTMASMAVADQCLIVRNSTGLSCIAASSSERSRSVQAK